MATRGPYIMREIPKSLGIDPILSAFLHVSSFLDFSDDETVDPDAAVLALEGIGAYLQQMTSERKADVRRQLLGLTKHAKKTKWSKDYIKFIEIFLENFGLQVHKPATAEKKVTAKKKPSSKLRTLRRLLDVQVKNFDFAAVEKLLTSDPSLVRADFGDRIRPIHEAALNGHIDAVRLLLKLGAKADAKDWCRRTPLYWAASNGHIEIIRLLLEAGTDINVRDKYGETPLTAASRLRPHAAEFLKENGGTT